MHLDVGRLIELLNEHQQRLYDLWVLSRNDDITNGLAIQRTRILRIISTLETLIDADDGGTPSCSSETSAEDSAMFLEELDD